MSIAEKAVFCKKCGQNIDEEFEFCPYCGKSTKPAPRKHRRRANGEGYIRKRGKTYSICITVEWIAAEGGYQQRRVERGGFASVSDANAAIPEIRRTFVENRSKPHGVDYSRILFRDLFDKLMERDEKRIEKSTINCYKAAYKHYSDIHALPFADLSTEDWQICVDDCPLGSRTKENMKALGTKLYKLANELKVFGLNTGTDFAKFVWIDRSDKESRQPFTIDELHTIRDAAARGNKGAQIILAMCLTGFRPSEFLALTHESYDPQTNTLRGGAKTEAGKNRIVPVHPMIKSIIARRYLSGTPYLFGDGSDQYLLNHFRESVFYPTLEALNIQPMPSRTDKPARTPYSTRHTFATLMKSVPGAAKDKAALMGHTSYEMTLHYTHEDGEALAGIVNALCP